MRRILTLLLLCACPALRAQTTDYCYPVRGVSGLCAANFGEIRPGHFHGGVDIKTDGVEGKQLVAVGDGYVSRVVITAGGYGRALYITLADGHTAVYGHLQRFRADIEEHLARERRARRSNDIDLWFPADAYPVRRGDPVGLSGNSGSSGGPHLHFELRDTPTQRLHNVVREGIIRPEDTVPPRIVKLHYIEIDSLEGLCLRAPMRTLPVVRSADGAYRLTREEPIEVGRKGYFVAEVTDRRNGVHNTFGIWRLTASVDGEPYFEYRMEGFTHDLSRCSDAVSCYALQRSSRNEAIRLARLEGAPNCFYPTLVDRGIVRTEPGQMRRIRIEVEDDSGNRSEIGFTIRGRDGEGFHAAEDPAASVARHDRTTTLWLDDEASVRIPAGALYEPVRCYPGRTYGIRADSGTVVLSPAYRLLDADIPLRQAVTCTVQADIPPRLRLRATLARCAKGRAVASLGGRYAEGAVQATTRTSGDIAIVADTLAPRIRPLFAAGADLTGSSALRFRVADNFSGIASWSLEIDGEWVPAERYPMQGIIRHDFTAPAARRRHEVRMTVVDAVGNAATWSGSFYR